MAKNGQGISLGKQGYIETIHELCAEQGCHGAGTKAIADKLGVKMPSVTQALQRLADAGLVNYSPRTAVTLTEAGTKLANELDTRHKILNEFFNSIGLAPEKADELACLVEHDIDLDAAMKIKLITGHLRECEGVQKLLAKDSN